MKQILTLIISMVLVLLTSCTVHSPMIHYNLRLASRDNTEIPVLTESTVEDSLVTITCSVNMSSLSLLISNKTNNTIKVIWDEMLYVDHNNVSGRIMHNGVRYIDRNMSQLPTLIAPGTWLIDDIVPTDNIYFVTGQYGGWRTLRLFPEAKEVFTNNDSVLPPVIIDKDVKLILPLMIDNVVYRYSIVFYIDRFTYKR